MTGLSTFLRCRSVAALLATILGLACAQFILGSALSIRAGGWAVSGELLVPLGLLTPLVAVGVLTSSIDASNDVVENLGARPIHLYRASLALALLGATALALVTLTLAGGGESLAIAVTRNLLGFWGMALVGSLVLGSSAWLLPVIYVGNAIFFGVGTDGSPMFWAWCLEPGGTVEGLLASAVLVVAGLAAVILHWRLAARSLSS